jgi:hypothetical protein
VSHLKWHHAFCLVCLKKDTIIMELVWLSLLYLKCACFYLKFWKIILMFI